MASIGAHRGYGKRLILQAHASSFSSCSSTEVSTKPRQEALETQMENKFFGIDNRMDTCDFLYKEDLFEDVRSATHCEDQMRTRKVPTFMDYVEFFKIIFGVKS